MTRPASPAGPETGEPQALSAVLPPHTADRRLRLMGVLNVTPDSFSDGGRWASTDAAVAHGIELREAGADLVDVGGESTRPGARRVPVDEELARVVPVLHELSAAGVACSVDTTRAAVAEAAVDAGAVLVNDVSGGLADPLMAKTVAAAGVPWVLMHWRAHSLTMTQHAYYDDVVTDVMAELTARIDAALAAGVAPGSLVIDPGLGFAKTAEHNWALLRALPRFVDMGFPVLVGASRKRFLPPSGAVAGSAADLAARDLSTAVLTGWCAAAGAWGVRVHDLPGNVRAAAVGSQLAGAW
jgi:dihydropteroate synthase